MKNAVLFVLLFLLLGAGAAGRALEAGSAELTFSSFDGGGPEYSVAIDDPEIVTYTWRKVYDNPDHEMMTGSGYKVICTFTGLRPGTTELTVSARSPIAENFDAHYTVAVDEALNVTLSCARAISRFSVIFSLSSKQCAAGLIRTASRIRSRTLSALSSAPFRRISFSGTASP